MTKKSNKILIANKESIICGWNLIKRAAIKNKTKIIPVDSEHFSILNLLKNHSVDEVKKIYITASGGPFLNYKRKQFKKIKPVDALNHPKWKMGKKISVDSSTLMNKILELVTSINNQMWLGHFDVWADEGIVLYRNTSLFNRDRVSQEQLDNVMVRAV